MVELKKRVFVLLNIVISQIKYRERYDAVPTISQVKNVLSGDMIVRLYEGMQGYHKLLEEVKIIMYLTDISVEDMIQVLDELREHYDE